MTIILSHISALEFWLSPRKVQPKIVRAAIPEKGPSSHERNRFLQRFANQLGTPVHTLMKTPWPSNGPFHHHSCSLFAKGLPLAVACEGVLACPVELAFVQAATHLPFPELVRLGFELCGAYSVDRTASGGFFQRKPLTTPQRIAQFACGNASLRGSAKARRALRYIAENAASPAETRIAMSLTLPLAEGGLGLPKAQLNHSLPLGTYARRATGRHYFVCDLFWPDCNVAVEYDSDKWHTGSSRIANDARRRNILVHLGITEICITKRQFNDLIAFDKTARILSRQLRHRIHPRSEEFRGRQMKLRKQLLAPILRVQK